MKLPGLRTRTPKNFTQVLPAGDASEGTSHFLRPSEAGGRSSTASFSLADGTSSAGVQRRDSTPREDEARPKTGSEEQPATAGWESHCTRSETLSCTGGTGGAATRAKFYEMRTTCVCGNAFTEDSIYCRKCGMKRGEELQSTCTCGELFSQDARFCHKCGMKRKAAARRCERGRSYSILEPRRKQMSMLAKEISDAQVIQASDNRTVWSRITLAVRFALMCQWIEGVRWVLWTITDKDFIQTPLANSICGSVNILNAALIGIELEVNRGGSENRIAWFVVETIFLGFFTGELLLRFRSQRAQSFRDPVTVFDFCLVVLGLADRIVGAMVLNQAERSEGSEALFKVTLLRLVRLTALVRVLRVIKLFRYFRELVLLGRGIVGAMAALTWSGALIILFLYVCSILVASAYTTFARGEPSTPAEQELQDWFGSVGTSLLTLFQVMTLEEWQVVVRTSAEVFPLAWIPFVPFILVANIALLNAVTAVVVENVWSIAQNEASDEVKRSEKLRAKALATFKTLFKSIDVDHNALLDQEEFKNALDNPKFMGPLLELGIARCEADELFELCDVDGNRVLSVAEFVDGCLRVIGPGKSKHLMQVQYDLLRACRSQQGQIRELEKNLKVAVKTLSKVRGLKRPKKVLLRRKESSSSANKYYKSNSSNASSSALYSSASTSSSEQRLGKVLSQKVQRVFSRARALTALKGSNSRDYSKNPRRTNLRLSILRARNLGLESANIYCVCEVPRGCAMPARIETWAVSGTANPDFDHQDEVFDYSLGEAVTFSLLRAPTGDLIGKAFLVGSTLLTEGVFDGELHLEGPNGHTTNGSIAVHVSTFCPPPTPDEGPDVAKTQESTRATSPCPPSKEEGSPPQPGGRSCEPASSSGDLAPADAVNELMPGSNEKSIERDSEPQPARLIPGAVEDPDTAEPEDPKPLETPRLVLEAVEEPGLEAPHQRQTLEAQRLCADNPVLTESKPATPEQPNVQTGAEYQPLSERISTPIRIGDLSERISTPVQAPPEGEVPGSTLAATPPGCLQTPTPPCQSTDFSTQPCVDEVHAGLGKATLNSLLADSRQEQRMLNRLLGDLLDEARSLHGHVSEVASLTWKDSRTPPQPSRERRSTKRDLWNCGKSEPLRAVNLAGRTVSHRRSA